MSGVLADAISPEGFLLVGACFVLVPLAGVVLVEAVVLWRALRLPFRRAFGWSALANAVSAIAGVPILLFFMWLFGAVVPSDLNLYFRAYFWFSLLRYVTYFAASVAVEYWVDGFLNDGVDGIAPRRLFLGVALANAVSYVLICPVLYLLTRPTNNLRELSADTSWCRDDHTPIFYIDPKSRHLFRTTPAGHPADAVVPYAMSDYQLSSDLQTCVFADDTKLYAYRIGSKSPPALLTVLPSAEVENGLMSLVTISPSGLRVAYTTPAATGHTLSILNLTNGRFTSCELRVPRTASPAPGPPLLLWTKREDALLAAWETDQGPWRVARLDRNDVPTVTGEAGTLSALRENHSPQIAKYCPVGSVSNDAVPSIPLYAFVTGNLLYQWLEIGPEQGGSLPPDERGPSDDPENIVIADPPGIPLLSAHRRFGNVAILPGSHLVRFADDTFSTLYLIDPSTRRLGKLTRGRSPMVPTPPYEVASLVRR